MKEEYDTFDFLCLMSAAYDKSFTGKNVLKSFAAAGIGPFNPTAVFGVPLPLSEEQIENILDVDKLAEVFERKRQKKRDELCVKPVTVRRGWVDTSKGLKLTRTDVMNLVERKERIEKAKRTAASLKEAVASEKEKKIVEIVRIQHVNCEHGHLRFRVAALNMRLILVPNIK